MEHIKTRLPKFRHLFEYAGKEFDVDWRLLAAMAYQESRGIDYFIFRAQGVTFWRNFIQQDAGYQRPPPQPLPILLQNRYSQWWHRSPALATIG